LTEPTDYTREVWFSWPNLREAAAHVGISVRQLRKYVTEGDLEVLKAPDRSFRFKVEDLDELKESLEHEKRQALVAGDGATPEKIERAAAAGLLDVVKYAVEGMKAAQAHAERMVVLCEKPAQAQLEGLRAMNAILETQAERSFASRLEVFASLESAKSEQHMRDALTKEMDTKAAKQREVFELLKKAAPHLVGMGGGLGAEPKKAEAAVFLLQSLARTPDRLTALMGMGVLSEAEQTAVATILDLKPEPAPVTEKDPPAPAANGAAHD
jgi:hypothetical protein